MLRPGINVNEFLSAWGKLLAGHAPLLSIEITRECPLNCPGCYAYSDTHLGGGVTLRGLNDLRGDALVEAVLGLIRRHRPLHVSLVGGEPMVRIRELHRILPDLGQMGVHALVVTSGIVPIPREWTSIPRLRVAVSVDGLPEHHDVRRKPATYDRILRNIRGCTVNIHWVITRPMLARPEYLEEYVAFWSARPEVNHIWVSLYSPQVGEQTAEVLTAEDRQKAAEQLATFRSRYPKFLFNHGMASTFLNPPRSPRECLFSRLSTNYSADLKTRVEPCVLGGQPDCANCGCAASIGLHWVKSAKILGPLRVGHAIRASMAVGGWLDGCRNESRLSQRWHARVAQRQNETTSQSNQTVGALKPTGQLSRMQTKRSPESIQGNGFG